MVFNLALAQRVRIMRITKKEFAPFSRIWMNDRLVSGGFCILLFFLGAFLTSNHCLGQCAAPSASVPIEVCKFENFELSSSTTGTAYEWDVCPGNLKLSPSSSVLANKPMNNRAQDFVSVFDGSSYFLFAVHDGSNSLTRVALGPSSRNSFAIPVNLGNPSGLFATPISIDVFKMQNNWYGIVFCSGSKKLILLDFENSLLNTPTASVLYSNIGEGNTSLTTIVQNHLSVLVLEVSKIKVLTFDNGISLPPSYHEIPTGISYGIDIVTKKNCDGWVAFLLDYNARKIFRVDLNPDLTAQGIVQLAVTVPVSQPYRIALVQEGADYHLFVTDLGTGTLVRVDLSMNLKNLSPTISTIPSFNASSWTIGIINDFGLLTGFTFNSGSGDLVRFDFPDPCSISPSIFSSQNTGSIQFTQPGVFNVALKVLSSDGTSNSKNFSINVLNASSPDISFSTQNVCAQHDVIFNSNSSSQDIISHLWNFGDSGSSAQADTQHQYISPGEYIVSLTVTTSNACKNEFSQLVRIFGPPVATFDQPSGLICTNTEFTFINTIGDVYNGNLQYEWFVDNELVSDDRDLKHSFLSQGDHSVKLLASIPGCSDDETIMVPGIKVGPTVDFSVMGECQNENILFNCLSNCDGVQWDFGNGQLSSVTNPIISFANAGDFFVSLSVSSPNGCIGNKIKTINIKSTPNPYFFIDLPPFSCSGSPTQFHDDTPPPTDSNIISWQWFFNDGSGASSTQKDPLHTFLLPGIYDVGLQVESNYGCSASTQLPIEIAETPSADFLVSAACLNKPTQFENASSPGIKSWSWMMGNSFYTFPDPVHTFTLPGSYPVSLTVKGFNDCESSFIKTVEVKPVPSLDFSVSQSCTNQPTVFTDQTTGTDVPSSWLWDFGNSQTASGSPASFTFTSSGAFPVGMKILTESGCEYSLLKNVVVAPSPVASFTTSASFGPPPLLVQFTNTSSINSSLLWEFHDPLNSTSTNQNPLFTFSEIGDYLVQLTATNNVGCWDIFLKTIQVMVPQIDLALEALEVQESLSGQSFSPIITVRNNSNINISGFDVFVIGSSGTRVKTNIPKPIPKGDASTIVVPIELFSKEKYLCVELAALGDTNTANNSACENLSEVPVINNPYPNPTTGTLYLEAVLNSSSPGKIKIFDTLGQLVLEKTFPDLTSGMNRFEVDLSGNRPGLFIAIWEVEGKKSEFKFLLR
jgi:PKD repeat protein